MRIAVLLAQRLRQARGFDLELTTVPASTPAIRLAIDPDAALPPGGYALEVDPAGIRATAASPAEQIRN